MRGFCRPTVAVPLSAALAAGVGLAGAEANDRVGREQGDYRVAQWTTQEGLPQNTVTDMVFLSNGEMWLATFGGLARFDGHGFRVLDMASDEGLPANRIVALAPAGADSFLFLTQQGHLGRVEAGRSAALVPLAVPSLDALGLLVDRSGMVFCQLEDGSLLRTDSRHPWQRVLGAAGAPGGRLSLALDAGGEAWAVWGDRLVKLAGGRPGAQVPLPEREAVLVPRPGGGFWVGLRGGIGAAVDGRLVRLEVRPRLEGKVLAIAPAGARALWAATAAGVSRLDQLSDGSWRRTPLPLPLLPAPAIRSLRLDREGGLWVGSAGGGLLRVHRSPTRRFGAGSGLGEIAALAPDGDGGAFVASGCRALLHLDRAGAVRPVPLPAAPPGGPPPPCGISLAPGPGGAIWVRTGRLLLRLEGDEAQLVSSDLPSDEGPIVANPDGSIWVASRSGGVRLLSRRGKPLRDLLRLAAPLMSASLGPDGALWIGGDGEVFRVGPRGTDRIGRDASVPRGLVRDILVDPDGTAWIGTYGGGLGRLRAGRVFRLTVAHGLPDNSISRILDDGRGRLWLSTNRGIAVAARSDLEAVADGRAWALAPVVIGTERGVPEANFGSPAGFAEGGGRLWFGTIDGAVSIDAAAFPFNTAPPVVRIEEVRADDRPLPLGPTVRVPPLAARLRVGYTALSLLYPERMRFRFRVEGVDADWVEAGAEHTVDWSPPGPGRYRFLVEARNEDGIWSSAPAALVLDVRPAWWQTTAFRLAASVAGALLALAVVRQRIRGIERRHAERVRVLEEQRQADERVSSLRLQLEHVSRVALAGELAASLAHEVRQPIGAIVNNAEAGRRNLERYLRQPEEIRRILDDIVADGLRASEVVQGLRGFLGAAGPETAPVDLSSLVREVLPLVRRELEDNRVEVDMELTEPLPAVEGLRVQLGQVVVNLLLNACEALAKKDGERRVAISTAARAGHVELAVSDNGPGLDPEVADRVFEPFVTTKPGGLGVGLAICRSIAERHGGHLSADTPPGGGLRMTLTLPAARPQGAQS
jgi:signal transduction histidine kinase/ligand-binding sensor domain-containing protein